MIGRNLTKGLSVFFTKPYTIKQDPKYYQIGAP